MYLERMGDAGLWALLQRCDEDLAAQAQEQGCRRCHGALHRANYPRKPRGASELPASYWTRLSYCCGREGCRARVTPPSLRFLGRRVYVGVVVLLMSAMRHGVAGRRTSALCKLIGADARTLSRWRRWWTEVFVRTRTWAVIRGRLSVPVDESLLPSSLLRCFSAPLAADGVAAVLRLLMPLSTRTCEL